MHNISLTGTPRKLWSSSNIRGATVGPPSCCLCDPPLGLEISFSNPCINTIKLLLPLPYMWVDESGNVTLKKSDLFGKMHQLVSVFSPFLCQKVNEIINDTKLDAG